MNDPKQKLVEELQAEMKALQDDSSESFAGRPRQRLFVEILFVLFCAAVGGTVVWPLTLLPVSPWARWFARILFIISFASAGIWTIVRSSQKYRRYHRLSRELDELQAGGRDPEFVTERADLNHLNDVERWILGKPEATAEELMAHPQKRAFLLPGWQLIGQPHWHLLAAFVTALALNLFACYVLFPAHFTAGLVIIATAPLLIIFVFLRWWMFLNTNYRLVRQPSFWKAVSGQNHASLYQHWLLLHRLKRKGLINPDRMEPFEDGFPTTKYLFSVFSPFAVLVPVEGLTVNSTKLSAAFETPA
jgi:hypothetical protein